MAEHVVAANRDDRITRMYGGDEFGRRAIPRTVMPNFEHIGEQIDSLVEKSRFSRGARVAGEKHAEVFVRQNERD